MTMTLDDDRTERRRRNEPEWEPKVMRWYVPGTMPAEPGLYWFDGFVDFSAGLLPPMEGRFAVLVAEEGNAEGFSTLPYSAFHAENLDCFHGEWYGPFEAPPWLGEAMVDPEPDREEGEGGDGI